jgi:hypothetical protein
MARSGSSKSGGGSSRIRFIMLDAELNEGDLSQITEAITNALRPTTIIQQRLIAAPTGGSSNSDLIEDREAAEIVEVETQPVAGEVPTPSMNQATAKRPKKYRSPKVIDLDLTTDLSFANFAELKKPTNHHKRFLVVATWFKQYRGIDAITIDHVYTCYRAVGWPTAIADFDGPFPSLLSQQLVERAGKGTYAINHLGVAEVDKLREDERDDS